MTDDDAARVAAIRRRIEVADGKVHDTTYIDPDLRWLCGRVVELTAENTSARRIVDTQAAMLLAATNRRDEALGAVGYLQAEVRALRERMATLTGLMAKALRVLEWSHYVGAAALMTEIRAALATEETRSV